MFSQSNITTTKKVWFTFFNSDNFFTYPSLYQVKKLCSYFTEKLYCKQYVLHDSAAIFNWNNTFSSFFLLVNILLSSMFYKSYWSFINFSTFQSSVLTTLKWRSVLLLLLLLLLLLCRVFSSYITGCDWSESRLYDLYKLHKCLIWHMHLSFVFLRSCMFSSVFGLGLLENSDNNRLLRIIYCYAWYYLLCFFFNEILTFFTMTRKGDDEKNWKIY